MERFVDVVDVALGKSETIVTDHGVNYDPSFSPDGAALVFHRTDVENSLDLYTVPARPQSRDDAVERLDAGGHEQGRSHTGRSPSRIPSRLDKKPVPATLMVLEDDRSHAEESGAGVDSRIGSDQNFLGWHPGSYRMYYSSASTSRSRATSS